jgi:hypothetical protein
MTQMQLHKLPAFRQLPIYDEHDARSNSITTPVASGLYMSIRECATLEEVERCLSDPHLVPLGAVRAGAECDPIVVAYFGANS